MIDKSELFFPDAITWMWNYCIYLGSYTAPNGKTFDLGVYKYKNECSFAIVYGNEDGDYISGDISNIEQYSDDFYRDKPWYKETIKLAMLKGLI